MPYTRLLLLLAVTACSGAPQPSTSPGAAPTGQSIVLVSLDGFRWDYLDRGLTPNMQRLADRGVRAQWMTPVFPTKTYPNHYTIVTGLYPENHGIVANNMMDSVLGRFRLSDSVAQSEVRWWGGEPIWRTLQQQGGRAAPFFWPGAEAAIGGAHPWNWRRFDDTFPNAARVDTVLKWLSLPRGEAPTFTTLYYSDLDHAGHDAGPESPQLDSALVQMDMLMGRLIDGLASRGLSERVNVIIVSDHGMIETPANKVIALDDYIDLNDVDVVDWTPVGAIVPKPGKEDAVYRALSVAHPMLKVYRKGEVPARFHFNAHPRITPLVLVAEPGWSIGTRARAAAWNSAATHGWDHEARGMGALFLAAGPAFREGVTVAPFQNIHLYELFAHILGITPAPNDGTLDSVRNVLRGVADPGVSADRMRSHLVRLSSDAFEGRKPGTRGDTVATRYISTAMAAAGLTPGAVDGGWLQSVPLLRVTPEGSVLRWQDATSQSVFSHEEMAFVATGAGGVPKLDSAAVVFVGHGIVSPDGRWDDYKGVDVRGKVVTLIGGPPESAAWQATGLSYSARTARETAMQRGAAAVAWVAGPVFWQAMGGVQAPRVRLASDTASVIPRQVLVHRDATPRFFGDGTTLARAMDEAGVATFRPRTLRGKISIEYTPGRIPFASPNVIGFLPGSDPTLREEAIVVTAHWDAYGRGEILIGDKIFNGALDNGIGSSQMLEMARVLAGGPRLKRSIVFVATTAEEVGLLGATHYVAHPRVPMAKTVAAVNLDFGLPWGRTRDVVTPGDGYSSLDALFAAVAATQGRRLSPDPYPQEGFWNRSDHVPFARAGVPALYATSGFDYIGRPAGWGKALADDYLQRHYHRPSDEVQADWDLRGAAEDADAFVEVIRRVANAAGRPTWNVVPKTESFREAQQRQRAPE